MLVHLLGLLTSFIGPLILWLVKKDESQYIDRHGRSVLNFQFSIMLYFGILLAATVVIGLATLGIGFFLMLPVLWLASVGMAILGIVCGIIGCVRAYNWQVYDYPLSIRFLK